MCVTINKAELSKTKILSIPVGNGNHFIAYSNSVKNLSGKANAMILAIPGKTKPEWFYDTTKYKNFLDDIISHCDYTKHYLGIQSKGLSRGMLSFENFQVGQYNVGLTDSFQGVLDFIKSKAVETVVVNKSLIEFYERHYKDWSFAVCLFDNNTTIDAQPIAFEYTPSNPDSIYFPTMDAHTGDAPDLKAFVDVDHTFIYEHTGVVNRNLYQETVVLTNESLPNFLKERKYRCFDVKKPREINGDTFMSQTDISSTLFSDTPHLERG